MLYSNAFYASIKESRHWLYGQVRGKKYLPFYLEGKKRSSRPRRSAGNIAVSTSKDVPSVSDTKKPDVVTRLASCTEALEVLRSLRCSLPSVEPTKEGYLFRLWTRIDVKRIALRGMAMLPHPVGPNPRVVAICEDDEAPLAIECGAAYAGLESILERIAGGWTNFDSCVTTTVHMPKLVKVARILGPKKLMPNMKEGTLSSNILEAVRRLSSANSVQFRASACNTEEFQDLVNVVSRKRDVDFDDDQIGVIEVPIARIDAPPAVAIENAKKLIREVMKQRPTVSVKTIESQFQWPPIRKDANTILSDAFSSLSSDEDKGNRFIIASGFSLSRQGARITSPVMVEPSELI
ncbi:54S ribosomal protein L1 [Babesia gibsoni]|uniref:54S ribosomal protein L1 n=1 Tax=Babesia gibsoni TaxID=33632 RepID=A0AAD8PE60_BABGI|nr:54S ribosomal protein L1 [Babesia gibsoni]